MTQDWSRLVIARELPRGTHLPWFPTMCTAWLYTLRGARWEWIPPGRKPYALAKRHPKYISIGDKLFRYGDFFSEKIIVGPQEAQYPQFLLQLPLTHYILRSIFFRTHSTPPICLKTQKCAILSTFSESGGLVTNAMTLKLNCFRYSLTLGVVGSDENKQYKTFWFVSSPWDESAWHVCASYLGPLD